MSALNSPQPRADLAALMLRLSLGILFAAHAGLKLFVFTPAGTYAYFEKLGLPGILGHATIAGEFAIAAALILGIATRWAALAGIPILLGAIVLVHGAKGFWATNGGWEFIGFWIVALVVQVLLGDGKFALSQRLSFTARTPAHA